MPATKKRRPPMEMEPDQEVREGSEATEGEHGETSRKRTPRNAKRTKAPMDGEGCGCGGGGRKKCTCDGGCGSSNKMDSALTVHQYLDACELGIQRRSNSYIRARLDAASRLDLKCGASGIAEGKKCHVGGVGQATPGGGRPPLMPLEQLKPGFGQAGQYLKASETGGSGRGYIRSASRYAARRGAVVAGLLGGVSGAAQGYQVGGIKGAFVGGVAGGALNAAAGAALSGTLGAAEGALEKGLKVRRRGVEYNRRRRYGDSVWASGFQP